MVTSAEDLHEGADVVVVFVAVVAVVVVVVVCVSQARYFCRQDGFDVV